VPSLGQRLCAAGFAISPSDIAAGPTAAARECRVHRAGSGSGLPPAPGQSERIGPVVARVVVAVIVPLLLPPSFHHAGSYNARTGISAVRLVLPMRLEVPREIPSTAAAAGSESGKVGQDFDFRGGPWGPRRTLPVRGPRSYARARGRKMAPAATRNMREARGSERESALRSGHDIRGDTRRWHCAPLQRLRRLDSLEEIAGLFPIQFDGRISRPLKMSTVIRRVMKCLLCRERACSMTGANTQDRASAYSVAGADTQDVLQDH